MDRERLTKREVSQELKDAQIKRIGNNTFDVTYPNGNKAIRYHHKELKALNKSILKYVDGYIKALLDKKIPTPSGGDCWYCGMRDVDSKKPLGEAIKDTSHLIDHMKEKYYVPSLIVNAIEMFPVSIVAKSELGYLLGYHNQTIGDNGIVKLQAKSSLRRYMRRQLGMAA